MDLLQGETPKQKYEYLQTLLKPKEKKFEIGAKAIIAPKLQDAFFVKGDIVTIKYNFMLDRWICEGRIGQEGVLSEDEMELI
jgi:hypothetical protein